MTDDVSFGFQQEQGVLRVNIPYDPRKSQPPTPVQPPPPPPHRVPWFSHCAWLPFGTHNALRRKRRNKSTLLLGYPGGSAQLGGLRMGMAHGQRGGTHLNATRARDSSIAWRPKRTLHSLGDKARGPQL